MHNNLIDNSSDALSMQVYLKKCFYAEGINKVQIATGYWDIPGMALIINELTTFLQREETSLELLIGKDPYVYTSLLKTHKYKDEHYPYDFIRTDIHNLDIKDEYKDVINLLLKYCENGKIKIRVYSKNAKGNEEFLHSKCYIFSGAYVSYGIIGSSNFTSKGLVANSELNYLETDPARITAQPTHGSSTKGHICWFEEKWNLAKEWTQEFLEQIVKKSPIYNSIKQNNIKEFTPYEQYIKLLQIKFGDIVNKSLGQQIEAYLPTNIHKLQYQIEAVKRCISIMHEHGGFILADVVGLGKTIIGTLIIKYFLSSPQEDGREHKVLVITPPAIKSGWKKAIATFDKNSNDKIEPYIDLITTGRIANIAEDRDFENDDDYNDSGVFDETLQNKNYGFILIDESHKFRNSNTIMYRELDELISNICFKTGTYPYIGLLSATPQNNRPNDLKNQIYLFERNRKDSTLKKAESGNLEKFFANINREYELVIKRKSDISEDERRTRLDAVSKKLRECVLNDILERRTRTDVKKYYENDLKSQGIVFPEIVGPNKLEYIMDDELSQLFYETMKIIAPTETEKQETNCWLKYTRYRAIEFFNDPENEKKHAGKGNLGVKRVAKQLATIMQILLVKRLESSFTAFTTSLLSLRRYTDNMIKMWDNNTIFVCPQINVNEELDYEEKTKKRGGKSVSFNDCVEDIRKKIKILTKQGKNEKGQNAEYTRKDFKEEYYVQLKEDFQLISNLYDKWAKNSEDPKFDAFKENLKAELFDPKKNTSQKLVIFSEAINTVTSIARTVKAKGYKPLVITADNRNKMEHIIEENFDANYEGEWKNDYNVIITTEVLAEGINLHRANVILNYDTPWNSTRLMQRIGRVNRIGSKEPCVYVYNFMPSAEGDAQIQLVRKAHTKLQSFHILFGEDSKIFSEEESLVHYALVKAIDGEESPMQKYIYELKQYKEDNPERYLQIEQNNDNWQIAQASSGTAYFIVKAPNSAKLDICINSEGNAKIISASDILEGMCVDEKAKRVALPNNWHQLVADAIKTYNQYFIRINKSNIGDKATKAKEILVEINKKPGLSDNSKILLKNARKLVDRGSFDIIKKILYIGKELEEKNSSLFAIEQKDIEDVLEREIGKLVDKVKTKQGEPSIILGTIK